MGYQGMDSRSCMVGKSGNFHKQNTYIVSAGIKGKEGLSRVGMGWWVRMGAGGYINTHQTQKKVKKDIDGHNT